MIRNFIKKIKEFFTVKTLREGVVYASKNDDIMVEWRQDLEVVKIFVYGVVYVIPIINETDAKKTVESVMDTFYLKNLDGMDVEELEDLKIKYEQEEDYDTCTKIQDVINSKTKLNE